MTPERGNIFLYIILFTLLGFSGCAGPLDDATEQALRTDFTQDVYQAKVYLGNEEFLEYTNNSVDGRSPTGLCIDRNLKMWYETDASFWEAGSSGHTRTLRSLQMLDRDLNFDHYVQGIAKGQLVRICEFTDKSEQLIVSVETIGRYSAEKDYGNDGGVYDEPRRGRVHFWLGKEGMKPFDRAAFEQMFERVFVELPPLTSAEQRHRFVQANYPHTPLADLVRFTGLSPQSILGLHYAAVLAGSTLSPKLQEQLAAELATASERWPQILGVWLEKFESGANFLNLQCEIQEISNSLVYHSPELRAGLLFFDGAIPLLKDIKHSLLHEELPRHFDYVTVSFSYLFYDRKGRRNEEDLSLGIPCEALQQFLRAEIDEQGLADRSEIFLNSESLQISLEAQKAVENIVLAESTTWKDVTLEVLDYEYEEDDSGEYWIITGEVINRGNWIARDIEVFVKGYSMYGSVSDEDSTSVNDFLKPDQTKEFTIKLEKEDVDRFEFDVEWKVVE